jgi:hypothetical protein
VTLSTSEGKGFTAFFGERSSVDRGSTASFVSKKYHPTERTMPNSTINSNLLDNKISLCFLPVPAIDRLFHLVTFCRLY